MSGELHIRVDGTGGYQPYRMVGATHRLDVGEPFATPREAIDFCNANDPATRRADDVPDLTDGFWGAVESRDGEHRQSAGSPVAVPPDRGWE